MFYVEWDLRRSWLSQAENICQTCREEAGEEGQGTTRYVINRNSNNNNCHTNTRTYGCLPRLLRAAQPFKCGFTLIILGVKCKRLPQQKVCILQQACQLCLSVPQSVWLSVTLSLCTAGCLRVSFCCRATSLFGALCVVRLLRHFKAPLTTLRMCNFHNFHYCHTQAHSHSYTDREGAIMLATVMNGN